MELNEIWFLLIGVLFTGFFFLEGFDFGVGILTPFLGRTERERGLIIRTISPHWDANEVWLITAGGAMFAAFPDWYATLFSGFYLALFVILLGLIFRGVAFKFRNKADTARWRMFWDGSIFFGSFVSALLWGVAFANIVRGVPIDENMTYTGDFFTLLNPYSLLGGLVTLSLFTLHGALFLDMKTDGPIRERVAGVTRVLWPLTTVLVVAFVVFSISEVNMFEDANFVQFLGLAGAVVALLSTGYMIMNGKFAQAFIGTGVTIVSVSVLLFATLFPNVMISSTDPTFNMTIERASSSQYTLEIMSIVALFFVPVVLIYQGWTYWVFRKRVTMDTELEY